MWHNSYEYNYVSLISSRPPLMIILPYAPTISGRYSPRHLHFGCSSHAYKEVNLMIGLSTGTLKNVNLLIACWLLERNSSAIKSYGYCLSNSVFTINTIIQI